MSMVMYRNNHSVFSLHYLLILVVKYRRRVINDEISARLRQIFEHIGTFHQVSVEEWNHDGDHVHVMFRAQPDSALSKFIASYKSASSRLIKDEFPYIRKYLWKEMFWSRAFCLLTTGGATIDTIRHYIAAQGEA